MRTGFSVLTESWQAAIEVQAGSHLGSCSMARTGPFVVGCNALYIDSTFSSYRIRAHDPVVSHCNLSRVILELVRLPTGSSKRLAVPQLARHSPVNDRGEERGLGNSSIRTSSIIFYS